MFFHLLDAVGLDVAGDDSAEGAAQVGGKAVGFLIAAEVERAHAFVAGFERGLEDGVDRQHPVEVVGVAVFAAVVAHGLHAFVHRAGDFGRVVDDDAVAAGGLFAEGVADELVDHLEVVGVFL